MGAPFPYLGGKSKWVKDYLRLMPPHSYYLEVFGGAGGLLFAKTPAGFEVYNDKDESLYNFFYVLRDKALFEEFVRLCSLTLYSRREYKAAYEALRDPAIRADRVRWAWAFWVSLNQGFGGMPTSWGINIKNIRNGMSDSVNKYLNKIQNLPLFHARMMRVQVENKDWRELLEAYSGYGFEEEFVFLDPPYYPSTRDANTKYNHEMSIKDHEQLIEYLLKNERRVMLCGYDNELYAELERAGWQKIAFRRAIMVKGRTRQLGLAGGRLDKATDYRTDCVWVNYDIFGRRLERAPVVSGWGGGLFG